MIKENSILRHVVLFAFKKNAGDGVQEVEKAFCRLPQGARKAACPSTMRVQ